MFTTNNLSTSNTNAFFTDQATSQSTFEAGTWWDKSSLEFENNFGGDCNEIYSFIKNGGSGNMAIESKYYVYFSPSGNPVNPQGINGQLVFSEGIIPKMSAKGTPVMLTYKPLYPGFYKFVAFQHPNKPGENGNVLSLNGISVTFSDLIKVGDCSKPL